MPPGSGEIRAIVEEILKIARRVNGERKAQAFRTSQTDRGLTFLKIRRYFHLWLIQSQGIMT